MEYKLVLNDTVAGTGYYACLPAVDIDLEDALAYLRDHPFDEFMHQYLLKSIGGLPKETVEGHISATSENDDPVFRALLLEAGLLVEGLRPLQAHFTAQEAAGLCDYTPALFIRSALQADQALHWSWSRILGDNIQSLVPLPAADTVSLAAPVPDPPTPGDAVEAVHVGSLFQQHAAMQTSGPGDDWHATLTLRRVSGRCSVTTRRAFSGALLVSLRWARSRWDIFSCITSMSSSRDDSLYKCPVLPLTRCLTDHG